MNGRTVVAGVAGGPLYILNFVNDVFLESVLTRVLGTISYLCISEVLKLKTLPSRQN